MKMMKDSLLRVRTSDSKNNVLIQQTFIHALPWANQFTQQEEHSDGDITDKSSYMQEKSKSICMSSSEDKAS